MPTADFTTRFWTKTQVAANGCWLWTGSATGTGFKYGQVSWRARYRTPQKAHRVAWEITNGPIPDNLMVLHKCDVPLCVNPNHLFLGTQSENLVDARRKGRLVLGRHLIKVDDAGVADILANYRPRHNGRELAAKYGITLVSLCRIVAGTQRVQPQPVFERVPFVQMPVRGDLHLSQQGADPVGAEHGRECVLQARADAMTNRFTAEVR